MAADGQDGPDRQPGGHGGDSCGDAGPGLENLDGSAVADGEFARLCLALPQDVMWPKGIPGEPDTLSGAVMLNTSYAFVVRNSM
ncbi:hypothetical protein MPRM_00160 [Mycobacterium parmense]|uniref:Uncharacterized protein n=1 Tax=Mycobacterium parmense TaxID=185642 RepID=A0A7I7YLM2_9MYCO|nr:hypothetical protein MPRM_00160 [Mycobacterium parmense]